MSAVRFEQLKLNTLADLDGRIEALFQKHLSIIAADCMSRPTDETARKLKLEFELIPVSDPADPTVCDQVTLSVSGESTVPKYRTKTFQLCPTKAGFKFNHDLPEDIDQAALFHKDE